MVWWFLCGVCFGLGPRRNLSGKKDSSGEVAGFAFRVHAFARHGVGLESFNKCLSGLFGFDGLVDPQQYKHETHSENHGAHEDDPVKILRHNLSLPYVG